MIDHERTCARAFALLATAWFGRWCWTAAAGGPADAQALTLAVTFGGVAVVKRRKLAARALGDARSR